MQSSSHRYRAVFTTEELNPGLVDTLYEFRKRLFIDLMGWDLAARDGRERDQFDTPVALYSALFRDESLIGCFRAIRTDKDYLVRGVFPHLATLKGFPQRWDPWEISRFGVLPVENRIEAARVNYSLMFRFAQVRQATTLVALADLTYERFLTQLGIRTRRYGQPQCIGTRADGEPMWVVAGEIPLPEQRGHRFESILELARHVEINDETLVLGRSRISA
jgi:N-acyl-L-homoserine lactone synthetase